MGPREHRPVEILFERVRPSQCEVLRCELRFCGKDTGWDVRFLSGSRLLCNFGEFSSRASAIKAAEDAWRDLDGVD